MNKLLIFALVALAALVVISAESIEQQKEDLAPEEQFYGGYGFGRGGFGFGGYGLRGFGGLGYGRLGFGYGRRFGFYG